MGYLKKLEIEENLTDLYHTDYFKRNTIKFEKKLFDKPFLIGLMPYAIKYMNNMDITKKIILLMPMSDPKRATTPKPMALK